MTRTQCFALGMVLLALGVAALFQVIDIDHVLRLVSIAALGTVSVLAAMVFFLCAFERPQTPPPSEQEVPAGPPAR
jgi:hypothetical protein